MPEGTHPKRPAHPPQEAPEVPEDPPSLPLRMYLPGEPGYALPPPSRGLSCSRILGAAVAGLGGDAGCRRQGGRGHWAAAVGPAGSC